MSECFLDDLYKQGLRHMAVGMDNNNDRALSVAMHCFKKAAEGGHAEAQCGIAICFVGGMGIEKNIQQAEYWAKKSSEQGNPYAMAVMGVCCLTKKDYANAEYWFQKSMDAGNSDAEEVLERLRKTSPTKL